MTTMAHTELRDGDRIVHFDGELIGQATSEYTPSRFHKVRWTEIRIYRTTDAKYVITKIGKSRVVHARENCKVLKNNEDPLTKVDLDDPSADYEFCDPQLPDWQQCWTDESLDRASYGYLENVHAAVTPADNPAGAIAACYSRDRQGVFSLSWLAKQALENAFDNDDDLEFAYDHFDIGELGRRSR